MLTLTLLRHAKSSWDEPLDDYDRPLALRGMKAAPEMGGALDAMGLTPDVVICSGAVRARETLQLVLDRLGGTAPHVVYDDSVYMATPATLMKRLRAIEQESEVIAPRHVMLVGHNPGLEVLALELCGSGDSDGRKRMAQKFPTAAAAVITFDAKGWGEIKPGGGRLKYFITPKQVA